MTDPLALVAAPEVEAVVIASPDATHPALVRACAEAGKPVLCEKPLSPTLAESVALINDLGAQTALVSIGFMRRFDPGYTDLRAAIDSGSLGAPLATHSSGRGVSAGPGSTAESSITQSAVHEIDIVPWLLGAPVEEVSWHAPRRTSGVDFADPQLILLRTADGALSTVETFLNARYGYDVRCEVLGEHGTASLRAADPDRGRPRPQPRLPLPRRLAPALRRRLPARAAGLGRPPPRRGPRTAGDRPRRHGRERGGRRGDRLDAVRRRPRPGGRAEGRGRRVTWPDALPASRVPDPREAPTLRWGVVGTGWIAERFVSALQRLTTQQVVAVGSRSQASADAFARRFAIAHAHGSYEDLVADPDVDVVYVATPHNSHRPHAGLALEAGKHVLVEKPITLNAREAQELADLAAARGLFLAEALWSLFTPKFDVIRQVLDAGVLGEISTVIGDNGEWFDPDHRIQRHDLAGGPLLDLGTYPFTLTGWVLGAPTEVVARGTDAPSGVNGQIGTLLAYASGARAVVHTTILANTPVAFVVAGSEATLTIPGVFYRPGPFSVVRTDGARLDHTEPEIAYDALAYQAAEVARRITAGEHETPVRPLRESIATMALMDEVRRQIGQVWDEER